MENKNQIEIVKGADERFHLVYSHNHKRHVSALNFVSEYAAQKWLEMYVSAKQAIMA